MISVLCINSTVALCTVHFIHKICTENVKINFDNLTAEQLCRTSTVQSISVHYLLFTGPIHTGHGSICQQTTEVKPDLPGSATEVRKPHSVSVDICNNGKTQHTSLRTVFVNSMSCGRYILMEDLSLSNSIGYLCYKSTKSFFVGTVVFFRAHIVIIV